MAVNASIATAPVTPTGRPRSFTIWKLSSTRGLGKNIAWGEVIASVTIARASSRFCVLRRFLDWDPARCSQTDASSVGAGITGASVSENSGMPCRRFRSSDAAAAVADGSAF